MYNMMKKQNFGVEIELTGITREQAANVIATYFGTRASYLGTYYRTYGATDRKGRTWKAMSDGSIKTERKTGRGRILVGSDYSCEVVTPVLQYEDLEDLQNVVRALREAGAITNSSCGIHVHVDGKNHTPASLTRLMNFAIGRQDLFYEALEIGTRANHWCKKMNSTLLKAIAAIQAQLDRELEWKPYEFSQNIPQADYAKLAECIPSGAARFPACGSKTVSTISQSMPDRSLGIMSSVSLRWYRSVHTSLPLLMM